MKREAELISKKAKTIPYQISQGSIDKSSEYIELLKKYNERIPLVSRNDVDQVVQKHFNESISLLNAFQLQGDKSLIDVGTGGGFPGLPLKLFVPGLSLTLVDSRKKKCTFLRKVKRNLNLTEVEVIHKRVEDFPDKLHNRFNYLTIRALGDVEFISQYCAPLLKEGNFLFAFKGKSDLSAFKRYSFDNLTLKAVHPIDSIRENKIIIILQKLNKS